VSPAEPSQLLALIVEDNPDNLLLTQAVLRRAGYRTAQAQSAEEALERVKEAVPDVILMDIQLPGQDGLSLTRLLKADPTTAHVPVVALSAHAMQESRQLAKDAGCDGYITKPINTRMFASQLSEALSSANQTGSA